MNLNQLKLNKLKRKLDYQAERREYNKSIKKIKSLEHRKLVKKHRKLFIALDVIMILIIFSNLGATLITNMLVMKVEPGQPQPQLAEVNPVVAENSGYVPHVDAQTLFTAILVFLMVWTAITFLYVHKRRTIYLEEELNVLIFFVLMYGLIFGWDFINDLGFFIGKIFYS